MTACQVKWTRLRLTWEDVDTRGLDDSEPRVLEDPSDIAGRAVIVHGPSDREGFVWVSAADSVDGNLRRVRVAHTALLDSPDY